MRLGILSDTHDQRDRTIRAIELLRQEGVDVLIHCGDVTGAELVRPFAGLPCYFTFGNHDADSVPTLERAIREIGGVCLGWGGEVMLASKRIGIVHGHLHTDVRRLMRAQPHYLFSGHTHIPADRQEGATRRINPGALHDADAYTVAWIDLHTDVLRFLTLPERACAPIEHPS